MDSVCSPCRREVSAAVAGPIAANNLSLWIGWDSHRTENAWKGRIDDVRIYSYALDAKEIGTLYESSRKPGDTIK